MKKYLKWTLLPLLALMSGSFFYFKGLAPSLKKETVSIKEIQSTAQDTQGAPQDVILFSDGTTLKDIGYDVVSVGTIDLEKSSPVFLFKSYSCRACEPTVYLWIYNSQEKKAQSLTFPGKHYLVDTASQEAEFLDHVTQGVFGRCRDQQPAVILSEKWRDGVSEDWIFKTTTLLFTPDGKTILSQQAEDELESIQNQISSDCHWIEPEDRSDYQ